MKKFILPILAGSVMFAACGETATEETKTTEPVATEKPATEQPTAEQPAAGTVAIPKMSTPEAQKFVEEYDAYVKASIDAAKSGDAAKVAEVQKSAQDWAKKVMDFGAKLTPEDAKLWSEYVQKVAAQQTAQ